MGLRLTTWNVNGIRNPFGYQPWSTKRTFEAMFEILECDIIVMQELKIQRKDLKDDMVHVPGWDCFFSLPKHKKGYSGVGIYTRQSKCQPIRAEEGLLGVLSPPNSTTAYRDMPDEESVGGYLSYSEMADLGVEPATLDSEGRCVIVEFPAFVVIGVYCPANTSGTELGTMFRHAFWNALDIRIRKLDRMGKRVILTGDLNNALNELDIAGAEDDKRKEGVTHAEYVSTPNRRILNQLVEQGEVFGPRDEGREKPVLWDACRAFHPDRAGMYTHWDQKKNARPGNFGSRIDYVLCSVSMKPWVGDSNIQEGLQGSDHCPVYAHMRDVIDINGGETYLLDIMNPEGVFQNGQRIQELRKKATLPFSARLLPEFNMGQRQSIKDMFKRQPSGSQNGLGQKKSQEPAPSPSIHTPSPVTSALPLITAPSPTQNSSTTTSPNKNAIKRKPSDAPGPKMKKAKQAVPGTTPVKGQGTLRAFFRSNSASKILPVTSEPPKIAVEEPLPDPSLPLSHVSADDEVAELDNDGFSSHDMKEVDPKMSMEDIDDNEDGALPGQADDVDGDLTQAAEKRINSSESWGKLLRKPQPPLCEDHDEPCKSFTTKKKGANCGRMFYICARPLGPTGDKEKGTQWRCRTFIWASDWSGGT